jgi:hypothetical protein
MTTREQFDEFVKAYWAETLVPTMMDKGKLYADDDRFHNFRTVSAMRNKPMECVAGDMVIKQITLLYDLLDRLNSTENIGMPLTQGMQDTFDEVLKDVIIYCILIRGMLKEREPVSKLTPGRWFVRFGNPESVTREIPPEESPLANAIKELSGQG